MASIITFLEARIRHLIQEAERNKRSGYAEVSRWRQREAEYILQEIKKLEAKNDSASPTDT